MTVLDSGFRIPGQWIPDSQKGWIPILFFFFLLDSGFQSLAGFRIARAGFRISKAKNSGILESGFPYMGRSFIEKCAVLSRRQNIEGFHFHLPSDCAILKE